MSASLAEISIRRPVFAWILMFALIIFGLLSFRRLGISQLPDVDFPVVSISLSLNGAAPEVMESQVLDPIEDSIMQMDGIRSITSTAQQSSGSIAIEFELSRNIDEAMQEVKNHVDQVQNILPTNLFPPTYRKINPEDQPIMWLGLSTNDPNTQLMDLMVYAKDVLSNELGVISGVGNIVMGGYVAPTLRVWANNRSMNQLNITAPDLLQAIEQEQIEIPAGQIQDDQKEFNIRVLGEVHSPKAFGHLRIHSRITEGVNFRPTLLRQVAHIEEGTADIRRISRMNGRLSIGLGMIKQHGSNAVAVAQLVRKKVDQIKQRLPQPFQLNILTDNTRFIQQFVNQLLFTLILSAILTSIICYLFLGSWTSTLNVLMAIPTSIIGTFMGFYFFGFTLNTFTLLGLSLAIGIVVDDAIMMLENIVRHRELGEKKKEAALKGANEITFSAIAATIAIVAIFLPVIFMKGIIGKYFLQYGLTVGIAVILSLLEALTLTPMRCSRYLTLEHSSHGFAFWVDQGFKKLSQVYARMLHVHLEHRWTTLFVTCLLFIASLGVAKRLPSEMMPAQDQSMFIIRFKLPVGTSIGITDQKIKKVEEYLLKRPEIEGVFSTVGGFGGDAVNQGMAYTVLKPRDQRKLSQAEFIQVVRKEIHTLVPEMESVVQDLSLRGFAPTRGFPVEFIIQGPDWMKLTEITHQMIEKMKKSGDVVDINTDVQNGMPELRIIPDREKMAKHAVSLKTVTNVINMLMGGLLLQRQSQYPKKNHRYEIELRLAASERQKIPDLNQVMIRNNLGQTIPLSALVKEKVEPSLLSISRLNRSRAITVYGNPAPGHSQKAAMNSTEQLARSMLPAGYTLKMIGSSKSYDESLQSLIFALLLGIVVSYMVLASQLNSFIHPIAILIALPLSFIGAFLGLALGHQSINMYSLIGFILLMGIVKKNAILLVDFTNQCRQEKISVHTALLKACPVRLRPILMTSTATIAGALPEALSLGPGSETTAPMAIAIIGGVLASTLFTLFVVPCAYSLLSHLERPDT